MTILIQANTGCDLGCTYCYENPDRRYSQAEIDAEYDIEAIMDRLEQFKDKYSPAEVPALHGGEPLLMRDEHIERILRWIYEDELEQRDRYAKIQTNGTLLTDTRGAVRAVPSRRRRLL